MLSEFLKLPFGYSAGNPLLSSRPCSHYRYRSDTPTEDPEFNAEENYFGNSVTPASRCRHNYHDRTESAINRQINLFLHVGYVYNSMVSRNGGLGYQDGSFVKRREEWLWLRISGLDKQYIKVIRLAMHSLQ